MKRLNLLTFIIIFIISCDTKDNQTGPSDAESIDTDDGSAELSPAASSSSPSGSEGLEGENDGETPDSDEKDQDDQNQSETPGSEEEDLDSENDSDVELSSTDSTDDDTNNEDQETETQVYLRLLGELRPEGLVCQDLVKDHRVFAAYRCIADLKDLVAVTKDTFAKKSSSEILRASFNTFAEEVYNNTLGFADYYVERQGLLMIVYNYFYDTARIGNLICSSDREPVAFDCDLYLTINSLTREDFDGMSEERLQELETLLDQINQLGQNE